MTMNTFLDALKAFTEEAVKDMILPTVQQRGEAEREYRAAAVYKMRLPSGSLATKKVPYIIHQIASEASNQPKGELMGTAITVRSVFCVYNEDEQEGALSLVELIDRFKIAVLKTVTIGAGATLVVESGTETNFYSDDTAPYYIAEMVTVWNLPSVQREVKKLIT